MRLYNSYTQAYERPKLRRIVRRLKAAMPDILEYTGADSVVVSGKSGISVGFALLLTMDMHLVTVRKPGEDSHGAMIEGTDAKELKKYVILDDFVSSGATVERIIASINGRASGRSDNKPECVGVVCYQRPTKTEDPGKLHPRSLYSFRTMGFKVYDGLNSLDEGVATATAKLRMFYTDEPNGE